MRTILSSSARAYALAKTLRSLLRREGASVRLGQCQAILASMLGYDSWAELLLVTERRDIPASLFDEACPASLVEERRAFQAFRLMRDCIPTLDAKSAAFVVAALAPCTRPSQRPKTVTDTAPIATTPHGTDAPVAYPALNRSLSPREWLDRNGIRFAGGVIQDEQACSNAIQGQLSQPWQGLDALPYPVRVLAYIFALHLNRRRRESLDLREMQAYAMLTGEDGDHETVASMMRKHEGERSLRTAIERCAREHAFVQTVMARLLGDARKNSGVLASAEFLWLKGVDRGLWHALSNVGRRKLLIEGIGAMTHMDAEKAAGTGLSRINADRAVEGLRTYLAGPDQESDAEIPAMPVPLKRPRLRPLHGIFLR